MIKFSDLCKAYLRFWFVILICIIIVVGAVIIFTPKEDSYDAISTLTLTNTNNTVPSIGIANTLIPTTIKKASNTNFYKKIQDKITKQDPELGKALSDTIKLGKNLEMKHNTSRIFFTIKYNLPNAEDVKLVVKTISDEIIEDFNNNNTTTKLTYLNDIDVVQEKSKLPINIVLGVLIGLVLGIVLITFFVVFNPYVENKDLLAIETNTKLIAKINKKQTVKEIQSIACDIGLMLDEKNNKYVAFTTDTEKFDMLKLISQLASIFKVERKVLVLSYEKIEKKIDFVDYSVLNTKKIDKKMIDDYTSKYDIVLGICPNMMTSKHYLHMLTVFKDLVVITKQWSSKTSNILTIKENAKQCDVDVLGLIYQD